MLSLKWKSLELRRSDAHLCILYKQSNKLATYECDKIQKKMRAECTPGSRLSVINLSSHIVHVIIQARSRGRGRGGSSPPRNFQTLIKFCYKSGIFLKWTAVNGSLSFKVLSIIVRLCTVVLLFNLEMCKWTKSYFCSAKNNQQL